MAIAKAKVSHPPCKSCQRASEVPVLKPSYAEVVAGAHPTLVSPPVLTRRALHSPVVLAKSELKKNLSAAQEVLEKCQSEGIESSSSPDFQEKSEYEQNHIQAGIGGIREVYPYMHNNLDPQKWPWYINDLICLKTGNCMEQSNLAMAYMNHLHPELDARRISLRVLPEGAKDDKKFVSSHAFVLVGHKDDDEHCISHPQPSSVVLDPWAGKTYPASQIRRQMILIAEKGPVGNFTEVPIRFETLEQILVSHEVSIYTSIDSDAFKDMGADWSFLDAPESDQETDL